MTEKTSATVAVTDDSFSEDVLASSTPVLVDFWATWCGPCKMVEPILADLASEWADRLRVVRLDVDANPVVVRRYGVMSMPTLMVFRDGEPVLRLVGARGRNHLMAELDEAL
jgi:thioredoxin